MRILMHPIRESEKDNSFTGDLAKAIRERGVVVKPFRWRRAFISRYDVVHVHWPESLVTHGTDFGGNLKALLFRLLIVIWRLRRVRMIATVHNIEPHESLRGFRARTIAHWWHHASARVYLSKAVAADAPLGIGSFIPHQRYNTIVKSTSSADGPMLIFGYLRRYKSIESTIESFKHCESVPLKVVGLPLPASYGPELMHLVSDAPNVELVLGSLSNRDLQAEVARAAATLVLYPELYSSGAIILSLSVGTPVVLLDSPVANELRAEFGSRAVFLMPRDWNAGDIIKAFEWARSAARPVAEEALRHRSLRDVATAYAAIYRSPTSK